VRLPNDAQIPQDPVFQQRASENRAGQKAIVADINPPAASVAIRHSLQFTCAVDARQGPCFPKEDKITSLHLIAKS
jgi:hypothetical protein